MNFLSRGWRSAVRPVATRLAANERFPHASRVVISADHVLQRYSGARISVVRLGGFESILLKVPGRKTGKITEINLLAVPEAVGTYLVAGSNFGRPKHPLWSLNLMSAKEIDVVIKGKPGRIAVQFLEGDERAAAWGTLLREWPNYDLYERRSGREIRVFRLTPLS